MIGMLLNVVHLQVHKTYNNFKLLNYYTVLTLIKKKEQNFDKLMLSGPLKPEKQYYIVG